jgi:hypothetical protein
MAVSHSSTLHEPDDDRALSMTKRVSSTSENVCDSESRSARSGAIIHAIRALDARAVLSLFGSKDAGEKRE